MKFWRFNMRYQTYFGVPIPPFKEEKLGAGAATIRFVISGRIVSKKNNQQAVTVKKFAREWANEQKKTGRPATWDDVHTAIGMVTSKMRGNQAYNEFLETYKPIIQAQAKEWSDRLFDKGLVFPLQKASMNLRLYFKDRHITDTVNKQQTIQDLLIEAGIIANDDYKTLNPISSASACYYEELVHSIAFISLSFQLPKKSKS